MPDSFPQSLEPTLVTAQNAELVRLAADRALLLSRLESLTRAADAALGALRVSLAGTDAISTLAAQIAAAEATLRITREPR